MLSIPVMAGMTYAVHGCSPFQMGPENAAIPPPVCRLLQIGMLVNGIVRR
ncbi:hypothetical protein A6764_01345 [Brevibacillus sp. WF146]|nr:hypothetical protein [Brevibacillus sp. WF146]UYZ13665.1 hypothetical protein A6764_01345 [Brevibacillus sp. WF146]